MTRTHRWVIAVGVAVLLPPVVGVVVVLVRMAGQ